MNPNIRLDGPHWRDGGKQWDVMDGDIRCGWVKFNSNGKCYFYQTMLTHLFADDLIAIGNLMNQLYND